MGFRLKTLFQNEDIIEEEYFALHYRTGFTFKKHGLLVEINQKGPADRDSDYEKRRTRKVWLPLY